MLAATDQSEAVLGPAPGSGELVPSREAESGVTQHRGVRELRVASVIISDQTSDSGGSEAEALELVTVSNVLIRQSSSEQCRLLEEENLRRNNQVTRLLLHRFRRSCKHNEGENILENILYKFLAGIMMTKGGVAVTVHKNEGES